MSIDQLLRLPSYLMLQLVREARRIARNELRAPHVTVLACLSEQEAVAQKRISDQIAALARLPESEDQAPVTSPRLAAIDPRSRNLFVGRQ